MKRSAIKSAPQPHGKNFKLDMGKLFEQVRDLPRKQQEPGGNPNIQREIESCASEINGTLKELARAEQKSDSRRINLLTIRLNNFNMDLGRLMML